MYNMEEISDAFMANKELRNVLWNELVGLENNDELGKMLAGAIITALSNIYVVDFNYELLHDMAGKYKFRKTVPFESMKEYYEKLRSSYNTNPNIFNIK